MPNQNLVRFDSECRANGFPAGPVGPKGMAIDTARPEDQPFKPTVTEFRDGGHGRNIRLPCSVMKPAQVAPDEWTKPAHSVVIGVLIEIGVEAGNHR